MSKNIVIAFGGRSPEHEVSVLTAMQAVDALKGTDYRILPLYITKSGRWLTGDNLLTLENYQDLDALKEEAVPCTFSFDDIGRPVLLETAKKGWFSQPTAHAIHALIPALHGAEGENGAFQGACEMFGIPYGGSGVTASSLGMDKQKAKDLCRAHDIPVVEDVCFDEQQWETDQKSLVQKINQLDLPVMVKPVSLGSSIGVMKATTRDELIEGVETAFRYDERIMVERAVQPLTEVNCAVMGTTQDHRASVCEHPLGKEKTLSFADKYQNDGGGTKGMASADRIIPADISDEQTERIQTLSKRIFSIFGAAGIARLDFLINEKSGNLWFNEINTIPGSFSFYLWEKQGMNMRELMLQLIEIAIDEHRKKTGRTRSYDTNLLSEKAVRGIKGLKRSGDES